MTSGRRDEEQREGDLAEKTPAGASLNAAKQCETDRHVDRCGADRDADRHGEKPYGTQRSDDAGATPGRFRDDRGTPVQIGEIRRVVSLVPSLTEAIVATCPQLLVGCTDFCVRPPDMDDVVGHAVRRVRGTKNPDRAAIIVATMPSIPCARPGGFGSLVAGVSTPRTVAVNFAALELVWAALGWAVGGWQWAVTVAVATLVALGMAWLWIRHLVKRFGGLTGDCYGSINELTQTVTWTLLALALAVVA